MGKVMERTAEVFDASGDSLFMTGEGATFRGRTQCALEIAKIRQLTVPDEARFILDWKDENGDILNTFHLDADGFRALTGKEPRSNAKYEIFDRDFWAASVRPRRLA